VNPHNFYSSMPKDWEPVTPAVHPRCEVSVVDAAGKRWTITVRSKSVYAAIFAYESRQCSGNANERACPKLTWETICEVKAPDGKIHRRTYRQAMDWANRQAVR
jgi:hypothetical protein